MAAILDWVSMLNVTRDVIAAILIYETKKLRSCWIYWYAKTMHVTSRRPYWWANSPLCTELYFNANYFFCYSDVEDGALLLRCKRKVWSLNNNTNVLLKPLFFAKINFEFEGILLTKNLIQEFLKICSVPFKRFACSLPAALNPDRQNCLLS